MKTKWPLIVVAWLVTWVSHEATLGKCPDPPPVVEPAEGKNPEIGSFTATACTEDVAREHTQTFDTQEAADAFLLQCEAPACTDGVVKEVNE